jgi:hypothetical protein
VIPFNKFSGQTTKTKSHHWSNLLKRWICMSWAGAAGTIWHNPFLTHLYRKCNDKCRSDSVLKMKNNAKESMLGPYICHTEDDLNCPFMNLWIALSNKGCLYNSVDANKEMDPGFVDHWLLQIGFDNTLKLEQSIMSTAESQHKLAKIIKVSTPV